MSSEKPSEPIIAAPMELREGMEVNFNCSTPYSCLQEPVSLTWQGQDPTRSVTSSFQKLEPTGVGHRETLHMVLSWQDHDRTLRCELSVASFRSEREIRLQVQCECVRGHTLVAEPHVHGSPVKSRGTETVPEAKPDIQSGQRRWRGSVML